MVAPSTQLRLVLLASSTLASCVIVTERPVDSAPPPAAVISDPVPAKATRPLAASGGAPNKPVAAAALSPAAVGGAPGAAQTPAAPTAGGLGLGAAY
jgi:hypothetical protein